MLNRFEKQIIFLRPLLPAVIEFRAWMSDHIPQETDAISDCNNMFFQLIKQSQMILNFLAIEGRVTNEHIDYIWAAGQVSSQSGGVYMLTCNNSYEIPGPFPYQDVMVMRPSYLCNGKCSAAKIPSLY